MRHPIKSTILAVVLVAAAVTGAASATEIVVDDHDADTPLTSDSAYQDFDENDSVSFYLPESNANITISADSEAVEASGNPLTDVGKEYLQLDYRGSSARTIRVFVPDRYWTSYNSRNPGVIEGSDKANVTYTRIEGGNYTAVTWRVDEGPATVIATTNRKGKYIFSKLDKPDSILRQWTGMSIPFISEKPWQYIDPVELIGRDNQVALPYDPNDVEIQYSETDYDETVWVGVPKRDADSDLYYYNASEDNQTKIVSMSSDPPAVRWKHSESTVSKYGSIKNDIALVPTRIKEKFNVSSLIPTIYGGDWA